MLRSAARTLADGALLAPLDALAAAGIRIDPEHAPYRASCSADSATNNTTHRAGCAVTVFRAALGTTDRPLRLSRGGQREGGKDKGRGEQ